MTADGNETPLKAFSWLLTTGNKGQKIEHKTKFTSKFQIPKVHLRGVEKTIF